MVRRERKIGEPASGHFFSSETYLECISQIIRHLTREMLLRPRAEILRQFG
jgi:hypothetical protein